MMGAHGMKDDGRGRGRKRTRGAAALPMPKGAVRGRKRTQAKAKAKPIAAGWVVFTLAAVFVSWVVSGMASSMAFEQARAQSKTFTSQEAELRRTLEQGRSKLAAASAQAALDGLASKHGMVRDGQQEETDGSAAKEDGQA